MPPPPELLQDLREAYEGGNLIVLAGEGVSAAGGLPTRSQLAKRLRDRLLASNAQPEVLEELDTLIEKGRLVDAFSAAKHALGEVEFGREVRRATDDKGFPEPELAKAIAALKPKLRAVLTPNLDRFLERALGSDWEARSEPTGDLAQEPGYILKLHGTRSNQSSWVFTRDDYDQAMFASPAHQRTFEALFQAYPILFVGHDFDDEDFQWMLAKVRALSGKQPPAHYAFVAEHELRRPYRCRLLKEAGLHLLPYADVDGGQAKVIEILRDLAGPPPVPASVVNPGQVSGSNPRVLIAGPCFALSSDTATRVRRLWEEGLSEEHLASIEGELQNSGVAQAQLGAIVAHDVLIDMSPWRAFARWRSDGLRELEHPGQDAGDATLVLFAFPKEAAPPGPAEVPEAALQHLRERWPWIQARLGEHLAGAIALGGFAGAPAWWHALAALRPDVELVIDADAPEIEGRRLRRVERHDAEANDLTEREYLRALRVVAGQVMLAGVAEVRALHDVFIAVEIAPFGQQEAERSTRRLEDTGESAGGSGADDLSAELKAREELATRLAAGTMISAEAVLELARRVFLWGQAGTGKTTLLRWLACRASREGRDSDGARLPVWIPRLEGASRGSLTELTDRLVTLALSALHLPSDPRSPLYRALHARISAGEAHLFIDSLDEAPDAARAMVERLPSALHLHVASRMTEPIQGRYTEVELKGLTPSGAGTFLRSYFGDAPWTGSLLRELGDLPDGPTWTRTPVLLSLAAGYYRRKRRLAGSTLDLYAEVIGVTEDTEARELERPLDRVLREVDVTRADVVRMLSRLARRMLAPDTGEPTVTFAESELPRSMRETLRRSGLFTGTDDRLRFAHLTFGEYFAARSGLDLNAGRERWRAQKRLGRAEGLEVLPMAHAFEGVAVLQAALEEAETRDAPDHRMLRLLLRSVRYGGDGVSAFCEAQAARVLALVLARMQMPSGRFGDAERRLMDAVEPALLVLAPFIKIGLGGPAEHKGPLGSLLDLPGEVGTEAHVIAWTLGLRAIGPRTSRWWSTVHRVARALVRGGLGVHEVVELANGGEVSEQSRAVEVLGTVEVYRPLLGKLFHDPSLFIRLKATHALAEHAPARALVRERLWDDHSHVRMTAIDALRTEPSCRDALVARMDDRHSFVQSLAARVLGAYPEYWDRLRRFLSLEHADVAGDVIRVLAQDPRSRGAIRELLQQALERQVNWPPIVDPTVRVLTDDPESRCLIAEALAWPDANLSAATLKALAKDLHWHNAVVSLAKEGSPGAIVALSDQPEHRPLLLALVENPSERIRLAAIDALARDAASRDVIRKHLDDPAHNVCAHVIRTLANDPSSRPLLHDFFIRNKDASWTPERDVHALRAEIVRALAADESSQPLLMSALTDQSSDVREQAVYALADVPAARAEIRKLLSDPDSRVWSAVVKALVDEPQVRERLRPLMHARNWPVLQSTFHLLASEDAPRRELQELLRSRSWARVATFEPLCRDPSSLPLLYEIFDGLGRSEQATYLSLLAHDPRVKRSVREKLSDRRVVMELMMPWSHLDEYVAVLADDPASRPLLRTLFEDEHEQIAASAVPAMAGDPEAKPRLIEMLGSKHPAVRAEAIGALAGEADVLPLLRTMLGRKEDEYVRAAATTALASDPGSRETLRALLADPRKRVRTAAFRALAGDPEEQPRLWGRLAQEDEDELRAEIAAFLATEPASSPEARAHMRACLSDPFSHVRVAANRALSPFPSPAGVTLAQVPSLRLALHLHGARTERLSPEDHALGGRLDQTTREAGTVLLGDDPGFAEAVLGWLCVRLTWASPDGSLDRGRIFGEVKAVPASLLTPAATLLIRVAMDSSELPKERWLHPTHNLIEAWQVAKRLRARTPPAIVLACADVDFEDLIVPELAPGQVSWGPTYFGFRIASQD